MLQQDSAVVIIELRCSNVVDWVLCRGSHRLRLRDERRIIIRKSRFVDDATLCIEANKAARDLDRRLIKRLQHGEPLLMKVIVLDVGSICLGSSGPRKEDTTCT